MNTAIAVAVAVAISVGGTASVMRYTAAITVCPVLTTSPASDAAVRKMLTPRTPTPADKLDPFKW